MSNLVMTRFCKEFAGFFSAKYAFSFWKGRVALYAILKALDICTGDEVIVPGYTCVVNINPIKYLSARPVYVDIEPDTFNINTALLESKITPKTKVIIAQHTYGYPCDMDAIMNIAASKKLIVIEDCCLALGSKYKGRFVGTFGNAAYFSFQWNKPFTTGLGGMALTNDETIAEKIEHCRRQAVKPSIKEILMLAAQLSVYRMFIYPATTAFAQNLFRNLTKKGVVVGSSSITEFDPRMPPGFFKNINSLQARSGIRQLAKLDNNLAHRRKMAAFYDRLLAERSWVTRKYDESIIDPVMVRYPLRIKEKARAIEEAAAVGIELGSWFECPIHPIETPLEKYDYIVGMCPEAEKASREVVNLPLHPRTNEKTAEKTIEYVTKFTPVQ